jgi:hypothetical protein
MQDFRWSDFKDRRRRRDQLLGPGGFGGVTITKALTIDCVHTVGGVLASLTNGIVVNAGLTDRIVLRGLDIHGVGKVLTVLSLSPEDRSTLKTQ